MSRGIPGPEQETRYWQAGVEIRSRGQQRRIGGIGVPYNKKSRLLPGGFMEVVESRALAKTLADNLDVVCTMEHEPTWLLGSTGSGTLRLTDTPEGMEYECDLPDTEKGRDCYTLVESRRMQYSSIGFQAYQDEFSREGSVLVRHLSSIRLYHVSPVAQPGYLDTSTAIRSLAGQLGEDADDVAALAEKGELRSLFARTDQMVPAPPTVEPGVTPADLKRRMDANRNRAVDMNRQGRIDLTERLEKSEHEHAAMELDARIAAHQAKAFVSEPNDDGRSYYARVRETLGI